MNTLTPDGWLLQTERVDKILEQYLWMYFSYHQDDWNTWIPLAEFAYNNSDHSSTRKSPFFTAHGRDPHFDSVNITQDTPAGKLSTKIQSVHQDVKRELEVFINRFKRYSGKSRASPPVFNPGDMLNGSSSTQSSLFNSWNQSRHQQSQIGIKSLLLQLSLKKKRNGKSLKYWTQRSREENYGIMQWEGFGQEPERSTWEPADSLKNCPELVNDFHSLYPAKPGPNSPRA
ncbi:hypothetical protein O181_126767 [Austropuccinia psidii MF-1]|uniref:Chromo domain-containing protein n=1 Tax=Austropuccinia psidii MF-1 TaxID=1389203 RepID=A0A9Q3KU15_9BASI|nr:hypothetical protein [Austropuccinia psidii MF-1]